MSDENILISEIIDPSCNKKMVNLGPVGPQNMVIVECPSEEILNSSIINIYSTKEQKIGKNGFILYENINVIVGNCGFINDTSEIYIWKIGYYSVYTSIYHMETCQFSLLKNSNLAAPVSTVGSFYGSSQNTNYFIIQLQENDMISPTPLSPYGLACKLQMINNTNLSYMPHVTLIGSYMAGNFLPQITASITIQSIL